MTRRGPEKQETEEEIPSGLKRFFGGSWSQTSKYYQAAWSLLGSLLACGLLGWVADYLFGTRPKLMLVGLLIGGIFGFYWLGKAMFSRV